MNREAKKLATLFITGGLLYLLIEIVWRMARNEAPADPLMILVGGLAFVLIGGINEYIPWEFPFFGQVIIGTAFATFVEFVSGWVLNVQLGLGIWDYSNLPGNVIGQICPQFCLAWAALSAVAIVLDDYLRWQLFGEEKPHYTLF